MLRIVAAVAPRGATLRECRFCLTSRAPRRAKMQIAPAKSRGTMPRKCRCASGNSAPRPACRSIFAAPRSVHALDLRERASLAFRRMLPPGRDYDEIYRAFRWQVPAEFNIGVEVCDRWAERDPGKLAIVAVGADGAAARRQLRLAARDLEPARQCARRARRRAAATASRSCCRRRPRSRRSTSRSTSSAPSRCRSPCCSASRRSPTGCRIPAPRR